MIVSIICNFKLEIKTETEDLPNNNLFVLFMY